MYWRRGIAFHVLWILALTLWMCAGAAWALAGSSGGALSFLLAGVILSPPAHQLIATRFHALAPAKAALFALGIVVPIAAGHVAVDAVAMLESEAKALGFSSAGHMARARDLRLATPQALVEYDEALRSAAQDRKCDSAGRRKPLSCFDAAHRRAAMAFADALLSRDGYDAVVRDAIRVQREAFLAVDRNCLGLLDRIDQTALPVLLAGRQEAMVYAAAIWAQDLSRIELEELVARSRPGVSFMRTREPSTLEVKVSELAARFDNEIDAALQQWARQLVSKPFLLASFGGGSSRCRPAEQLAGE